MARIFHQNMRVFGGGTVRRNNRFTARFGAIQVATAPLDYIVAGFTEVMNPNPPLRGTLSGLAQALNPGLTGFLVVEVGTTALGTQEYIGIAWDPQYVNVTDAGQVLRNSTTRAWTVNNTAVGEIVEQRILCPEEEAFAADSRGVAYIAANYANQHFIFGFMHNMYSVGDRSSAYTSLNDMATAVRGTIGGYAAAEVIIGGDFNLRPRQPKRQRGGGLALHSRAATTAAGQYINTTRRHPYDFWVVSDPNLQNANAEVYAQTRVARASDHAAIAVNR